MEGSGDIMLLDGDTTPPGRTRKAETDRHEKDPEKKPKKKEFPPPLSPTSSPGLLNLNPKRTRSLPLPDLSYIPSPSSPPTPTLFRDRHPPSSESDSSSSEFPPSPELPPASPASASTSSSSAASPDSSVSSSASPDSSTSSIQLASMDDSEDEDEAYQDRDYLGLNAPASSASVSQRSASSSASSSSSGSNSAVDSLLSIVRKRTMPAPRRAVHNPHPHDSSPFEPSPLATKNQVNHHSHHHHKSSTRGASPSASSTSMGNGVPRAKPVSILRSVSEYHRDGDDNSLEVNDDEIHSVRTMPSATATSTFAPSTYSSSLSSSTFSSAGSSVYSNTLSETMTTRLAQHLQQQQLQYQLNHNSNHIRDNNTSAFCLASSSCASTTSSSTSPCPSSASIPKIKSDSYYHPVGYPLLPSSVMPTSSSSPSYPLDPHYYYSESFSAVPTKAASVTSPSPPLATPFKKSVSFCLPSKPALAEEAALESAAGEKRGRMEMVWSYLKQEVQADYLPAEDEGLLSKQKEMYDFFQVPFHLEKLLFFGFFVCMDCFLFLFTFLPPRIFLALLHCFRAIFSPDPNRAGNFGAAKYDVMRGLIFVICCYALSTVDVSLVYHYIRGQSIIKLYVIYNLLEIFDKLCSVFGQDIWDSLYLRAAQGSYPASVPDNRNAARALSLSLHFFAALCYVMIHALVLFNQMITLNVALNSDSGSLITVLVSNQFVELKSCVFKKFSKENLFQISCSDVVERFQIAVMIVLILLCNMYDLEWEVSFSWLLGILKMVGMIVLSEVAVDWVKHCFVTKFNRLTPDLYRMFKTIVCSDIVASRSQPGSFDNHHAVSRRIGFVPLPLACIVVRVLGQVLPWSGRPSGAMSSLAMWGWGALMLLLIWACLLALQGLLYIHLYAVCFRTSKSDKIEGLKRGPKENGEKQEEMRDLSEVSRFAMCDGKVP